MRSCCSNKIFLAVIASLFFIATFLLTKNTILGAESTVTPLGVDLAGQKGPNPAPPLEGSFPCGKTMCLKDEVCTKYPQDEDEHCVPKDKYPLPQPTPPQVLPKDIELCAKGEGTFPPNDECINNFKKTVKDIFEYDKTCIYEPVVYYESERWPDDEPRETREPYTMCGKGEAGPGNAPKAPASIDKYLCSVNMLVYTDVRDAEVGSYGPSKDLRDPKSPEYKSSDFIAQNYLYDALFGKPLDLTNSSDNPNNNREASRTYWRLLSAATQANLRSFTLNMAAEKQINNIKYKYKDTNGREKNTDLISIYNVLKTQVIFFLHFPFVRIGCLTDYPVCPEYALAIKELKPPGQDITDYLTLQASKYNIVIDALTQAAITTYSALIAPFTNDMDGPYAAFVPLDFDSLRSYIVMKPTPEELEIYTLNEPRINMLVDNLNKKRYGTNKPPLSSASRENIPYLGAIYQGLLSPKFGILPSLQASWITTKYATPEGSPLSDYKRGNDPKDFPEVKIAKENYIDFLAKELSAFSLFKPTSVISTTVNVVTGTVSWVYDQLKDLFNKEDMALKGYTKNDEDLPLTNIRDAYVNFKKCALPVSYHLISPKTASELSPIPPKDPKYSDHHQVITIWGPELAWSWSPKRDVQCGGVSGSVQPKKKGNVNGKKPIDYGEEEEVCICHAWPDTIKTYPSSLTGEDNPCINYTRRWIVSGIEHGKALTVLNNPKATDIKKAIVQDDRFSLYKTLLPDSFSKKKITDASIDAPYAANYSSFQEEGLTSTAPNGTQKLFNEVEPINRINNRAQDTTHLLQNCWTIPGQLQNSPRCKLELAESLNTSVCDGKKLKEIIGSNEPTVTEKGKTLFSEVKDRLSDDLLAAYAEAENQTGVPCEVLAGIHYREADNSPDQDLQSGAPLAGRSLTESAVQAANELLGKAGGKIGDIDTLIKALSYYNGGGNSNCQPIGVCSALKNNRCGSKVACDNLPTTASGEEIKAACTCGIEPGSCRSSCGSTYPFFIPTAPGLCPAPSIGYDDPYVVELWKQQHETMYVLYQYDCTQTPPINQNRLGTFTFALNFYLEVTSKNTSTGTTNGKSTAP